ncbi:hypothetical protein GCM10007860_15110 [Chitiniphilus shinanonensis]|uniref:Uncharacterized protein n=1 Tax=Chitiniphilus shinanonensis TaxID=553088 RepID=A0ABQ6BRV1_9NEIS|nr:hypothetical protein GCM10007860_15110 [Chitiniphilus shinanonensis]
MRPARAREPPGPRHPILATRFAARWATAWRSGLSRGGSSGRHALMHHIGAISRQFATAPSNGGTAIWRMSLPARPPYFGYRPLPLGRAACAPPPPTTHAAIAFACSSSTPGCRTR